MGKAIYREYFWKCVFWIIFVTSIYICYGKLFVDLKSANSIWIGIITAGVALLCAAISSFSISNKNSGEEDIKNISAEMSDNTKIFLKWNYIILFCLSVIIAGILTFYTGKKIAFSFLSGVICTCFSSYINILVFKTINLKIPESAKISVKNAFNTAFLGSYTSALTSVGITIFAITALYLLFKDGESIISYALGTGVFAFFTQIGGKIYSVATKDKNFQDTGLDLVDSVSAAVIGTIIAGAWSLNLMGAFLPVIIVGTGILASITGIVIIRFTNHIKIGLLSSAILIAIASFFMINFWLPMYPALFYTLGAGMLASFLTGIIGIYYGSKTFSQAKIGSLFRSCLLPAIIICIISLLSFIICYGFESYNHGFYGISRAALGFVTSIAIILAINNFRIISKNANAPAQSENLCLLEKKAQKGAVSNDLLTCTMAIFIAISLIGAFILSKNIQKTDILNPFMFFSIFIGGVLPFYFICGVSSAAQKVLLCKNFNDAARNTVLRLIFPIVIAIATPAVIGLSNSVLFGKAEGVGAIVALLAGVITSGGLMSLIMTNFDKIFMENAFLGKLFSQIGAPALNILIKLMATSALTISALFIL